MTTANGVLVLNRNWTAIHVCSIQRAIGLLVQDLAQVVTEDYQTYDFDSWRELSAMKARFEDHPMIHTPSFQLMLPRVIVLARYQRCPPRTVKFNRRNIFLRDQYTCQYCGCTPREDDLTIDHVTPRSRGGLTSWENVVLACTRCNTKKGNHMPEECGMVPVRPPRRPAWIHALHTPIDHDDRSIWQKFIDVAYWETNLRE